jgi:hypothetical protein
MMICNSCGGENENGTKFCGKCGSALPAVEEVNFAAPAQEVDFDATVSVRTPPPQAQQPGQFTPPAPQQQFAPAQEQQQQFAPAQEQQQFAPAQQAAPPAAAPTANTAAKPSLNTAAAKEKFNNFKAKFNGLNYRKILKFGIPAVVLLVGAIVTLVILFGGGPYAKSRDLLIFTGEDNIVIVYNNGKTAEVNGDLLSYEISMCGRRGVMLVQDGDKEELLYISGRGQPRLIARDVDAYVMSATGRGVVYWTNWCGTTWGSDATAELHVFNGRKSSRIENDVYFTGRASNAVISPNGKVVFYVGDIAMNTDGESQLITFISRNGKAGERFESGVTPVAISDGARHIYYVRNENTSLRVRRGTSGNSNLLSNSSSATLLLNDNLSQAVVNCDGRAFISIRGGERESFHGDGAYGFLAPENTQYHEAGRTVVYGFRDFRGKLFGSNTGIFMLTRQIGSERMISSDFDEIQMSQCGKHLFYIRNRHLRTRSATSPNSEGYRIARDVISFVITPNAKQVYFVDTNYELNRARVGVDSPTQRVAEPVDARSIDISRRGTVFFRERNDRDNVLYFTNNTTRNRVGDEIERFWVSGSGNNAFYLVETSSNYYDLYRSNGNGRFRVIARSVRPR